MTSGHPLYLVSACGTAEEFVAAFRRYADRTGLFVPAAAPLPAGRKGRIALTLKDGGVMIEGDAEILQSSAKPTVLYGRPGMTVKFVETDEPSKLMIGELEKARLAMRPAPTSATPRPATIPAEPRPVVPPTGGRIDAANALAECVVIGDVSSLEVTAGPARPGGFVVPSIPAVGGRARSPSTGPATPPGAVPIVPARPTATPQPPPAKRPTPTATPQPPAAKRPTPPSTPNPNHKMTSIGFPVIDKLPAQSESGKVGSSTTLGLQALERAPAPQKDDLLTTMRGAPVPPNMTPVEPIKAQNPLLETQMGTGAPRPAPKPPIAPTVHDEPTVLGEAPPKKADAPGGSGGMPAPAEPGGPPQRRLDPKHKATSIGFPALRAPFETQQVSVVPPPRNEQSSPGEPAPPILGKATRPAAHRSKPPTTPPLTPRHPTPVAPLPLVRPPAVAPVPPAGRTPAVDAEDEKTDLSMVPLPPNDSGPALISSSLPEEVPVEQVDPLGPTMTTARSGGMRASEIMAAIAPNEDWTMSPDASGPTVMPSGAKDAAPETTGEPTPSPAPTPGPPTGDWTISLDPEQGWTEPAKVDPVPPPKVSPVTGNPDRVVASDKALSVREWEEKPTGIGEAKIEIDATLMEPLKQMPAVDDDASPPRLAPAPPPPLAPMPPVAPMGPPNAPPSGMFGAQAQVPMPPPGPASNLFAAPAQPMMPQTGMMPAPQVPSFDHLPQNVDPLETYNIQGMTVARKRKRTIVIAISAAVAVIAGFVLVLVLASGKSKGKAKPAGGGSGSAEMVKTGALGSAGSPAEGSATPQVAGSNTEVVEPSGSDVEVGAGSAEVAVAEPDSAGSAETPGPSPAAGGTCKVTVSSLPPKADVLLAGDKLGTTPGTFELPCGESSKLTLKKSRFLSTSKSITPSSSKTNKLLVRLRKQTFRVKVTSTPAGATITAGGRTMGVTPTTIRLPGYEPTSITLTKPGYSRNVQRVTPKGNNTSHHVVLKKGR